ncbi:MULTISPECIES: glutaredoxin domain-containing protein [Clostridium]|uniref:Glutaredoxin n=2 Tax=Clostridium novyi TaxID=1542 RepID=A0Q1E6_CLONN|nr:MULTISPECIES: glutaredoxin domain-containing protein [Clostridium]ABK60616.1 Glutaredoxin [Clostridium novyi NT]KEH88175.1 glutaredoxin [Clostridium novyi A str. NCTC 538]KEH89381.1 glutaredoxin [Clostridium novyi A str. 4540]KEH91304.1 glutaredoxin [Clostridium novyi A str. BKT29909]KEH92944.1 glutaredoxin [Clostridium botulinum C/D str. It1]
MVKVYSIPDCPWCVKVKKYLNSKNIEFEDINVQENVDGREEMISLTNQSSVPVINVDGNVIIGFEKEKLDSLLNL